MRGHFGIVNITCATDPVFVVDDCPAATSHPVEEAGVWKRAPADYAEGMSGMRGTDFVGAFGCVSSPQFENVTEPLVEDDFAVGLVISSTGSGDPDVVT